jgi:flagellar FliL protein
MMKGSPNPDAEGAEVAAEKSKGDKKKSAKSATPVYVALDAFTVNLVPEEGNSQFLQVAMSVEVVDLHVGDRLKSYTPKLRNNVMMMLSGKKAAELLSKDGKETLANDIRELINDILEQGGQSAADEPPIKEVLFTSFIIQ